MQRELISAGAAPAFSVSVYQRLVRVLRLSVDELLGDEPAPPVAVAA